MNEYEYKNGNYTIKLLYNDNEKINIRVSNTNSRIEYKTEISLKNFNNSNNINNNLDTILNYLNECYTDNILDKEPVQKKSKTNTYSPLFNTGSVLRNSEVCSKLKKKIFLTHEPGFLVMKFGKIEKNDTFITDFIIYLDEVNNINESNELNKIINRQQEIIDYLCEFPEIIEKLKISKYSVLFENMN
jgi:hypothetical protein